MTRRYYFDERG